MAAGATVPQDRRLLSVELIQFPDMSDGVSYTIEVDGVEYQGVRPGAYTLAYDDGTVLVAYLRKVDMVVHKP